MRPRAPLSSQYTKASAASRGPRIRFSAKFRRASGNHFAPGMRWPSTRMRRPLCPFTPAQSQNVLQKSALESQLQR